MGAVTVLALILIASIAGLASRAVLQRALLRPYAVARGTGYAGIVTSAFVHADLMHLLFNLITFVSFAFSLERVIGTVRFLALYGCGLLVSSIGTVFKHRDDPNYASLGASGAILAVLFASIAYFPHSRLVLLPIPIPIPGPLFAVLYLVFSWYSARHARGNINHDAHLSGALAGIVFVAVTDPMRLRALWSSVGG